MAGKKPLSRVNVVVVLEFSWQKPLEADFAAFFPVSTGMLPLVEPSGMRGGEDVTALAAFVPRCDVGSVSPIEVEQKTFGRLQRVRADGTFEDTLADVFRMVLAQMIQSVVLLAADKAL